MPSKHTAAFGIYPDREHIEEAVENLKSAGFRNTDLSVLAPENAGTKDLAHVKHSKASEGAALGTLVGLGAGGTLGWFAGAGAIPVPALATLVACGPIVAAFAGAGAVGALGFLSGAIAGLGVPEYEARRYRGRVHRAGILLSVHCDSAEWAKRARRVLRDTGAIDVGVEREAAADFAESDKPLPRSVPSHVA